MAKSKMYLKLLEERRTLGKKLDAIDTTKETAEAELVEIRSAIDKNSMLLQLEKNLEEEIKGEATTVEEREKEEEKEIPDVIKKNITKKATNSGEMIEYRTAFMEYVTRGVEIPTALKEEMMETLPLETRAVTTTADIGAVIPTTILTEVIKNIKSYGQLYSRVRKLNIQGGVDVPIADIIPTATWITETIQSEEKKTEMQTKVSFGYHVLELRIAQSLLTSVVSLPMFEQQVTELLTEGMVKALDIAIMKGTGAGQPTGILKETRIPAANVITLTDEEIKSWQSWKKKVFAKIPLSYRANASIICSAGTWEGYIDGMVDTTGQPIARINYGIGTEGEMRFNGKEVILVEPDIIGDYETAEANDVIAVIVRLQDYAINSNMQLMFKRYYDEDKNKWVSKGLVICDGKVLDPNGIVLVKKQ